MAYPRRYGRYLLEERLAMGGMAEIFRARLLNEGFEKRVCIKRILPSYIEDADFVAMFRDEAALAARLQHGNIVQVFDFGCVEEALFLAMELVDGTDLRKLLDAGRRRGVRVTPAEAVLIAVEVCRGLHHAHTLVDDDGQPLGLVHRDISPHNVLISREGEVKVTDFGIAKAAERATHTAAGVIKGKVAYMAPEQAEGRSFDHRLDQFALGVVLWEMLTGERLFSGESEISVLRKVIQARVPLPTSKRPELPHALESVVMRALSADMNDRYEDMRAFERALSRLLYTGVVVPEPDGLHDLVDRLLGDAPPRRNTAIMHPPDDAIAQPSASTSSRVTEIGSLAYAARRGASDALEPPPPALLTPTPTPRTGSSRVPLSVPQPTTASRVSALRDGVALTSTAAFELTAPRPQRPLPRVDVNDASDPAPRESSRATPVARASHDPGAEVAYVEEQMSRIRGDDKRPLATIAAIGVAVVALIGAARMLAPLASSSEAAAAVAKAPEPSAEPSPVAVAVAAEPEAPPLEAKTAPTTTSAPPRATAVIAVQRPPAPVPAPARARPSPVVERGSLFVDVTGSWAEIWEDGTKLGDTPTTLRLTEGKHRLRLVNPETQREKHVEVNVVGGGRAQLMERW